MRLLRFILSAIFSRHAYIDMDGCLLQKMRMPQFRNALDALDYWMVNLDVTPIVRRRLLLLYLLKLFGVRLHIWTNRSLEHQWVTRCALRRHIWLFDEHYYLAGKKHLLARKGPCMDDQAKYIVEAYGDLLVSCVRERGSYGEDQV